MAKLSVVSPCFNEEANVEELYARVKAAIATLDGYTYEHIFIDNRSTDGTVRKLKAIAAEDPNVKVIVNTRNFGQIRSAFHAYRQATGNAMICMVSDLQDPPEMIPDLVRKWEEGFKVVVGVKAGTQEKGLLKWARKGYYQFLGMVADIRIIKNFTGFGLYDEQIMEILRTLDDPYPHFRGLICDLGFEWAEIPYAQPLRARGLTKNNFYSLYDMAMLSLTYHSKVPLRLATFIGFSVATLSLLVSLAYFVYKLIFWSSFTVGTAPLVIGLFFFASVQLIFLGVIGEYVGAIYTQVLKRPHVIEKERINF